MTDTHHRDPASSAPAAIRARLETITPGPWTATDNYVTIGDNLIEFDTNNPIQGDSSNDTDFIAHAPTDIAALLADQDALRAQIARLEQERDELRARLAKGQE